MSQTDIEKPGFVFTGRHMLAVMIAFFGVIISVNLLMAYYARSSWSGLVVENSYVASQEFNEKAIAAKEWRASGMKGEVGVAGSVVSYVLTQDGKGPLAADSVEAAFRRPVGTHQDFSLVLSPVAAGRFEASHAVLSGEWIVDLTTKRDGKVLFHEARRIHVGDGAL